MNYQKIGEEYLEHLLNDPFSLPVWFYLTIVFMSPATCIDIKDKLEQYTKFYQFADLRPMCFR